MAHNYLQLQSQGNLMPFSDFFGPQEHTLHVHTCRENTHTHKIEQVKLFFFFKKMMQGMHKQQFIQGNDPRTHGSSLLDRVIPTGTPMEVTVF